jgi:hypothetical protein
MRRATNEELEKEILETLLVAKNGTMEEEELIRTVEERLNRKGLYTE